MTNPTRPRPPATSRSACRAPSTGTWRSMRRPRRARRRASSTSSPPRRAACPPDTIRQPRMIIDIHGHYTTEPRALHAFRDKQLAGLADAARRPATTDLGITDEELVQSVEPQLRFQRERGSDLTIFSPRASGMGHHVGNEAIGR